MAFNIFRPTGAKKSAFALLCPRYKVGTAMAIFGILFVMVIFVLVGAGMAIGAFISLLAFFLVSLGVVSSSVLVGIRRRSAHAGIRAFFLFGGVLGGIPCGMLCAWIAAKFLEAAGADAKIFLVGGLGGAVGGLVLALMLDYV